MWVDMLAGGVSHLDPAPPGSQAPTSRRPPYNGEEGLRRLAAAALLPHVACLAVPDVPDDRPPQVLCDLEPTDWARLYDAERLDRCDPGLRAARQRVSAFTWSDLETGGRLTRFEARMMETARAHGLAEVLVVPVWSVGGWIGVVTLAGPGRALSAPERQEMGAAAAVFYSRLAAQRRQGPRTGGPLTERELEIVRWLAAGKSDWEIGQILDISAKTVNFHVENAKRKLGVSTRIQAVLRALAAAPLDD